MCGQCWMLDQIEASFEEIMEKEKNKPIIKNYEELKEFCIKYVNYYAYEWTLTFPDTDKIFMTKIHYSDIHELLEDIIDIINDCKTINLYNFSNEERLQLYKDIKNKSI